MSVELLGCPEKHDLVDYLLGKLPDDLLSKYEDHFVNCVQCEDTIRGLNASDTLNELAEQATKEDPSIDENDKLFVHSLIQRLQHETLEPRCDIILRDRSAEVTRLLHPTDEPGDFGQLAHYRLLDLIGAGSTGVVFRALDEQLDREVALKVLRPSLGQAARERFMAEARSAASINHPNVVTIYHVGVEDSLAFIAMQWLPGQTLEDRLAKVTFLPENEVREIARQIASGLEAAHRKNLIHRDIKPANIWLSEENGQAIILDFGLARIADDDPQMTNTGMLAGTPNFMSPEQTRGLELDGRSDLFSLGCLMHRAVTGKLPFGSTGILATLQAIQHHNPSTPKGLNPHVSEDFSDLIVCLLEKQPVNRPETANQVVRALSLPRSDWHFVAAKAWENKIKGHSTLAKGAKEKTYWSRWIAVAILIGLIGWGGFMYGPQIIRIATNHGELVFKTNDEDVKIEIRSQGDEIRVIDTKTQQKIDIKSGEYQIKLQDDRNGFQLSTDKIIMTRGGKQIVSIRKISPGSSIVASADKRINDEFIKKDIESRIGEVNKELVNALNVVLKAKNAKTEAETNLRNNTPVFGGVADQKAYSELQQAVMVADANLDQANKYLKIVRSAKSLFEKEMGNKIPDPEPSTPQSKPTASIDNDLLANMKLPNRPTYDGRNFENWLSVLKTERNHDTIAKGLHALGELSVDNPEMQEIAFEAVTPLIRRHGSNIILNSNDLIVELIRFFGYFDPERVVKYAINEIQNGTLKSRKQMVWLLTVGSVYEEHPQQNDNHRAAIRRNLEPIIKQLIPLLHSANEEQANIAHTLLDTSLHACFKEYGQFGLPTTYSEIDANIASLLNDELNQTSSREVATRLAVTFIGIGAENQKAVDTISQCLNDPEMPPFLNTSIFRSLELVKPELSTELVQSLIQLYDNQDRCEQIATQHNEQSLGGFGRQDVDSIRRAIISTFAVYGAYAKEALPLLDRIAAGNSPQKTDAEHIAAAIRNSLTLPQTDK